MELRARLDPTKPRASTTCVLCGNCRITKIVLRKTMVKAPQWGSPYLQSYFVALFVRSPVYDDGQ